MHPAGLACCQLDRTDTAVPGANDDDTFNVGPSVDTPITVNGLGQTTADALNVDLTGTTSAALNLTGVHAGQYTFGNRAASVSFSNARESMSLSPARCSFMSTSPLERYSTVKNP